MIAMAESVAHEADVARAREEYAMYEEYYGFTEKPFSLTPDPKYLFKSASHANAFELLQYAIRRREGFVVITGDIGTGKTTLCRAILEQLDRRTFTALVLNPFLSEEDLLKLILQDFGVVSRDEIRRGRLTGVTKQELIETLNEFLLSLLPLRAGALLIIDEAQNLPPQVLEQIRILSNLETDKEKLLQIVLVGQPNLKDILHSPGMRQLDQRVSIRYELQPLSREETGAYIGHRLAIAGGGAAVTFVPRALDLVHRSTGGIPRLINLLCDRVLLAGYSQRTNRLLPDHVRRAAESLELRARRRGARAWLRQRAAAFAAGAGLASVLTFGGAVAWQQHPSAAARTAAVNPFRVQIQQSAAVRKDQQTAAPARAAVQSASSSGGRVAAVAPALDRARHPAPAAVLPQKSYSVLVASFRMDAEAGSLATQLRDLGYRASVSRTEFGERGRWHQVFAGPYNDLEAARRDEARLRQLPAYADARLIPH